MTLLFVALRGFIETNILKISEKTSAEIFYSRRENTSRSNADANFKRVIKYYYEVNDVVYNSKSILWWRISANSSKGVEVGENIDVYYRIDAPNTVEVYHTSYLLIIVGLAFIVVPVLSLKQRLKEN